VSATERTQKPREQAVRLVTEHRRARFDYKVEEKVEAGMQLTGSEVKSLRAGTVTLSDAYALPDKTGQLFLHNAHIGPYGAATAFGHDPLRPRKLLMHRAELDRWSSKVRERGYSIIPLSIYFKGAVAKVELGLCLGKTHGDRRHDIQERETKREMDRALRRR
jgi:SsrA-binding protein